MFGLLAVEAAPAQRPASWTDHTHHHHLEEPLTSLTVDDTRAFPIPLSEVALLPGTAFAEAFELNNAYLRYLDIDRLLNQFRVQSGITHGVPYGGWESPSISAATRTRSLLPCVQIDPGSCPGGGSRLSREYRRPLCPDRCRCSQIQSIYHRSFCI